MSNHYKVIAVTTRETSHGNPAWQPVMILPAGILVELRRAANMPDASPIKFWAKPVRGYDWPEPLAVYADLGGLGLSPDDVFLVANRPDFDFTAECGILVCGDCAGPWYPMEVEDNLCPECSGGCVHIRPSKKS